MVYAGVSLTPVQVRFDRSRRDLHRWVWRRRQLHRRICNLWCRRLSVWGEKQSQADPPSRVGKWPLQDFTYVCRRCWCWRKTRYR